jgi:hypothetical protein
MPHLAQNFVTLFLFLLQQYIFTEPVVAARHISPRDIIFKDGIIQERQQDDLSYCYDEDNGICVFSNTLYNDCQAYVENINATQWYECICANGYVSVDQA